MDWRNENQVELARLKPTKHLVKSLPLENVIVEPKLNGRRYSLEVGPFDHKIQLTSRSRHDKTKGVDVSKSLPFVSKEPEDWMQTLATNGSVHVFDGELCSLNNSNAAKSGRKNEPKKYVIWDLLVYNGEDMREYPLMERIKCLYLAMQDLQGVGIQRLEIIEQTRCEKFNETSLDNYLGQIKVRGIEGYVVKELWRPYDRLWYGWKIKVKDNADGFVFTAREEIKHHLGERTRSGKVGSVGVGQWKDDKTAQVICYVALPEEDRCDFDPNAHVDRVIEFSHLGWDGERFMFPQFVRWRDDKSIGECKMEV